MAISPFIFFLVHDNNSKSVVGIGMTTSSVFSVYSVRSVGNRIVICGK
jgi:hypothetical protein